MCTVNKALVVILLCAVASPAYSIALFKALASALLIAPASNNQWSSCYLVSDTTRHKVRYVPHDIIMKEEQGDSMTLCTINKQNACQLLYGDKHPHVRLLGSCNDCLTDPSFSCTQVALSPLCNQSVAVVNRDNQLLKAQCKDKLYSWGPLTVVVQNLKMGR